MLQSFVEIGHTQKPHGLNGEIKVFVEEEFEEDFLNASVILLDMSGKPNPFFIESIRGSNQLIVKFEGIADRDRAALLSSKKMMMKLSDLTPAEAIAPEVVEDTAELDLVGYILIDTESNQQAEIIEIMEVNNQELLVVNNQGKELYIPFVEAWIIDLNVSEKKLVMNLPLGLFDL